MTFFARHIISMPKFTNSIILRAKKKKSFVFYFACVQFLGRQLIDF